MFRTVIAGLILTLSLRVAPLHALEKTDGSACCPAQDQDPNAPQCDPNSVDALLDKLAKRATDLEFYECKLDYIFKQPLLESQTRRQGTLAYAKLDTRSYLRIDFNTLQYDDEEAMPHKEQFLFDGVWGTYIDYQSHSVQRQQVAEPNAPVDAFALVSRRVPVLGFSKIDDLRAQFEIERESEPTPDSESSYLLHLKAKPNSTYHDDYVTIDVQIDKTQELPIRIVAVTTEEDVHEIKLMDPTVNASISRAHFEVEIPSDFSVENVPLKRNATPK